MGFHSRWKRFCCGLLTAAMVTAVIPLSASYGASVPYDARGHWAEQYISKAIDYGIIKGYPDGSFQPDKAVSRAEFTHMINSTLGNTGSSTITFSDVPRDEWYYAAVSKGVNAAFISGYSDGTFKPGSPVSRQEAAVVLSRVVPVGGVSGSIKKYSDYKDVSDWASSAMGKINAKGYIGPYNDGGLHPLDSLTRGQVAKIICDIKDKETIVTDNTVVKTDGSKLSGRIYSNGVTIHKDLSDGNATISSSVILGTLTVNGGGKNTVTLSDTRVANADVDRSADVVRLLARDETSVANLSVSRTSILETTGLDGGIFGAGYDNIRLSSSANVTLKGSFPSISIDGSSVKATLESGTISNLTVTSSGRGSDITVNSGTTISTATVNAASYFHGTGTINQMNVKANGITYETKPKNWNVDSKYETPKQSDPDLAITLSPKNAATGVYVDTKITLTFSSAMTKYNGKALSNADIQDIVSLRESKSNGSVVTFDATIDSAKKVFTLTPKAALDTSTKYYISIDKNMLRDAYDEPNAALSSYFTTGDSTSKFGATYYPANGAAPAVNTKIEIKMSEKVMKYDGNSLSTDDSYLRSNVVTFQRNGSNISTSEYDVSIDKDRRVISVEPRSNLDLNTRYYVGIKANTLKTSSNGTTIPSSSVNWTTAGVPTLSPSKPTVKAGDKSITATVKPSTDGTLYAIALPVGSTAPTKADQVVSGQDGNGRSASSVNGAFSSKSVSGGKDYSLDLTGLNPETKYIVYMVLRDGVKTNSGIYTSDQVTTMAQSLSGITITANGKGSNLLKDFSSSTYDYKDVWVPYDTNSLSVSINGSYTETIRVDNEEKDKFPVLVDFNGDTKDLTVSIGKVTYTIHFVRGGSPDIKTLTINDDQVRSTGGDGSSYEYVVTDPAASSVTVRVAIDTMDSDSSGSKNKTAISLSANGLNQSISPGGTARFVLDLTSDVTMTCKVTTLDGASRNYSIYIKKASQ